VAKRLRVRKRCNDVGTGHNNRGSVRECARESPHESDRLFGWYGTFVAAGVVIVLVLVYTCTRNSLTESRHTPNSSKQSVLVSHTPATGARVPVMPIGTKLGRDALVSTRTVEHDKGNRVEATVLCQLATFFQLLQHIALIAVIWRMEE
jgi:hypothetical protein